MNEDRHEAGLGQPNAAPEAEPGPWAVLVELRVPEGGWAPVAELGDEAELPGPWVAGVRDWVAAEEAPAGVEGQGQGQGWTCARGQGSSAICLSQKGYLTNMPLLCWLQGALDQKKDRSGKAILTGASVVGLRMMLLEMAEHDQLCNNTVPYMEARGPVRLGKVWDAGR